MSHVVEQGNTQHPIPRNRKMLSSLHRLTGAICPPVSTGIYHPRCSTPQPVPGHYGYRHTLAYHPPRISHLLYHAQHPKRVALNENAHTTRLPSLAKVIPPIDPSTPPLPVRYSPHSLPLPRCPHSPYSYPRRQRPLPLSARPPPGGPLVF
eukprot:scaffold6725_cov117-Isochrysis_galbana.AAC.8